MNFIREYWVLFVLFVVFAILEHAFHKFFIGKASKITIIILCIIGLTICEVFSITYNVDLFFACIAVHSAIELFRIHKEKKIK